MHPLYLAMRRALGDTTTETNRIVNTYTGWTYAESLESKSVPLRSKQPCLLDISDLENPELCYWCGEPLTTHYKKDNQ